MLQTNGLGDDKMHPHCGLPSMIAFQARGYIAGRHSGAINQARASYSAAKSHLSQLSSFRRNPNRIGIRIDPLNHMKDNFWEMGVDAR